MPLERLVLRPPETGHKILIAESGLRVPDDPIIPLIEGDGIGPDVVRAARSAIDAAVASAFGGRRRIAWYPVPAGERAMFQYGDMLPEATLGAIREYVVGLKGPLTTPVSGGFRSLNVALRKTLDLYANVRPVYWIPGVPSPVTHPERLDIVIFREGTEDVYAGIEWEKGTAEARRMIEILDKEFHTRVRADSGIGVKPISETGSKRLVRKAIRYAMDNGRKSVTLVHKGNIMKYTEGAFRTWGYEVAKIEFRESTIPWDDVVKSHGGKIPDGKIVIKDVIADNMFQQLLLRPEEYDVLATTNLNGDYLSDAAAAQIGGLGVAAGGNIGDAHRAVRARPWERAEVRRDGQGQPDRGDARRRDDARIPGLAGSRSPPAFGRQVRRRLEGRHVRSRPPHARGQGSPHLRLCPRGRRCDGRGGPVTGRAGHACRTNLETAICREMDRQEVPHEHRSLRFRVYDARGGSTKYEPAIVAHRGPILFLVEPIATARSGAVRRLTGFLQQHSPEIVLVLVTTDAALTEIAPEAYDEIYGASDVGRLTARIRGQDPEGIVQPFEKPQRRVKRSRDTAK